MEDPSKHALYNLVWEHYREFALTARKLKSNWEQCQTVFFWMTIGGTILAAAGSQIIFSMNPLLARILGISGAALLALVGFLSKEFFSSSKELHWTKLRAIAEALKSEVYLYATETPPYNEPSAGATLKQKADEQIGSVNSLLSGDFEKTDGKKPPTVPMDLKTYIKDRLNNQEDFYEKATIKAKKSYFQWRVVQLILGAIVIVLGVMVGFSEKPDKINALIVLISALTGIITSYTISGRYDYLCKSYGGLRRRMRDLAVEGQVSLSQAEFIAKCEIELSAEHRSWLTEWQKSPEANNTQSGNQTIES